MAQINNKNVLIALFVTSILLNLYLINLISNYTKISDKQLVRNLAEISSNIGLYSAELKIYLNEPNINAHFYLLLSKERLKNLNINTDNLPWRPLGNENASDSTFVTAVKDVVRVVEMLTFTTFANSRSDSEHDKELFDEAINKDFKKQLTSLSKELEIFSHLTTIYLDLFSEYVWNGWQETTGYNYSIEQREELIKDIATQRDKIIELHNSYSSIKL